MNIEKYMDATNKFFTPIADDNDLAFAAKSKLRTMCWSGHRDLIMNADMIRKNVEQAKAHRESTEFDIKQQNDALEWIETLTSQRQFLEQWYELSCKVYTDVLGEKFIPTTAPKDNPKKTNAANVEETRRFYDHQFDAQLEKLNATIGS